MGKNFLKVKISQTTVLLALITHLMYEKKIGSNCTQPWHKAIYTQGATLVSLNKYLLRINDENFRPLVYDKGSYYVILVVYTSADQ